MEKKKRNRKERRFLSRAESLREPNNREELVLMMELEVPEFRNSHLNMIISMQVLGPVQSTKKFTLQVSSALYFPTWWSAHEHTEWRPSPFDVVLNHRPWHIDPDSAPLLLPAPYIALITLVVTGSRASAHLFPNPEIPFITLFF